VPPLRNRMDDIPLLTEHFVVKALQRVGNPDGRKRLSTDAMRRLQEYHWPGNVRELENEIERLVVLTGPLITTIGQDLLSAHIRTQRLRVDAANGTVGGSLPDALERLERTMLYEQLKACRWNKTKAAGILGISRRNLIRKVAKYGFERRDSADHPNQD